MRIPSPAHPTLSSTPKSRMSSSGYAEPLVQKHQQQLRVVKSASETSLTRRRVAAVLPRLSGTGAPAPPPVGVSTALLVSILVDFGPPEGSPAERRSTRNVAAAMRQRRQEHGFEAVQSAQSLAAEGATHPLTGELMASQASVHVAHSWDADFPQLVDCLFRDSGGHLDRYYSIDVFGADHLPLAPASGSETAETPACSSTSTGRPEDPVASVQALVSGAKEVLLVLDSEGKALSRLWVLFEALLGVASNKLRFRSSAPCGFGNSAAAVRQWEARIDGVDWVLAETTRKSDDRRLRAFAERVWEKAGGVERLLAQLKAQLRREVYSQVLLGAVEIGDKAAVEAALDKGASLDFRDADGNTLEDLASFHGFQAIEDMLFERRMRGLAHKPLSMFFQAKELMANSAEADPEVLAPFMTQALDDELLDLEDGAESEDDADWNLLAQAERMSEQSTRTPMSSQLDFRG
eukprot:TRINITY_DN8424_c0_g1_i1.p1 TRINITY_DN8424_c0_g1~~TRINITY_DN8424_c0_g1_i1.p1  ORF type:complete len:464 (-),score=85.95 TRINITY_DN8424_c0_g1_i1:139-1530(-)